MKTNKYIIFTMIGFEMVALVLVAIYVGEYLQKNKGWPSYTQALFVVGGLGLWFVSLFFKLKSLTSLKGVEKNTDPKND